MKYLNVTIQWYQWKGLLTIQNSFWLQEKTKLRKNYMITQNELKTQFEEMFGLIRKTPIYHGTNSIALDSIEKYGLDPAIRSYDESQLKRLDVLIRKVFEDDYSEFPDNFMRAVFLTPVKNAALGEAEIAPETWTKIRNHFVIANARKKIANLSAREQIEAKRIYSIFERMFKDSYPVLISINPNAPMLKPYNKWLLKEEHFRNVIESPSTQMSENYDSYQLLDLNLRNDRHFHGWGTDMAMIAVKERIPRSYILDISKIK